MFRFIAAALLLITPVQAHPGHDIFENEGQCHNIATDEYSECKLYRNTDYFLIEDEYAIWTFTEEFDMIFGVYYSVERDGEYAMSDICFTSHEGIHCRSFSFLYG